MGHYNLVKPGDPFRPSAKLENEVRQFFNGGATISGGKSKYISPLNTRISATNKHTEKISAHTPVSIQHDDEKGYFFITPATSDTALWGVANEIIEPNTTGTVIISGVVNAWIKAGSGNHAAPGADGKLMQSTSGRAEILFAGDDQTPGMILLGGGGGSSEYNGYFKLEAVAQTNADGNPTGNFTVHIYNGSDLNDENNVSICKVNSAVREVPAFISNYITPGKSAIFALKFTAGSKNDNETTPEKIEIVDLVTHDPPYDRLPEDTSTNAWVQLGRVFVSDDGNATVYQDSYGIPAILWFAECGTN